MKYTPFIISTLFFSLFLAFTPAQAADPELAIRDASYGAGFVSQSESDPVVIEAGTTKLIRIKFKNTGTKAWLNEGRNYISAYTMEPRERSSVFYGHGAGWKSPKQIGRMTGTVQPGEIGELGVFLHAPLEVGTYKEEFYLSAENWSWVDGGYFFLEVNVVPAKTTKAPEVLKETNVSDKTIEKNETTITTATSTYEAKRIGLSKKSVEAVGGEQIKVIAIYQNTGASAWNGYNLVAGSQVALASVGTGVTFADGQWKDIDTILAVVDPVVAGDIVRQTFYFRAPRTQGDYTFTAGLAVDGTSLDQFDIDVHVTENAPLNYVAPTFEGSILVFSESETPRFDAEPRIRVGITTEGSSLQFVSFEDDYTVFNGDMEVGVLPKTKIGIMTYAGGVYSFKGGEIDFRSNNSPRLLPTNNPHAVFTLMNLMRPMSWVGPGDFNKYRGGLEYRKGENDDTLYAVNDLLLEDYVKGISETGRGDQFEFVKANLTAARTYAYISRGKYPFFDVLGSTYDQLYLGYNVEVYNPQVPEAAESSRGRMVTYQGEVVTTPYFGNSGGYTKSWKSVWGGSEKPWLQPVKATYDLRDGKWQFGHGVGMSQRDANIRAKEEGLDYIALLKYYYTGVDVVLMYE